MDEDLVKVAEYYDGLGRALAHQFIKEAAPKLPPGILSKMNPMSVMKALGAIGVGGVAGHSLGKGSGKKQGRKEGYSVGVRSERGNDSAIARRAYQMGVRRGAGEMVNRFRAAMRQKGQGQG